MAGQRKQARTRRPIAPEDLLRFRVVCDPQIAPDGRHIVFVEKRAGSQNRYVTNLWMVGVTAGDRAGRAGNGASRPSPPVQPRRFTFGDSDQHPLWSPDGGRIAFIRETQEGQPQIYAIGLDGGEACQLSNFPEGSIAAFRWSPDGTRLAVRFRPQDPQRTAEARKERQRQGLSDPPWVIEDLLYRIDGEGCFGGQRYRLYLVEAHSGQAAREIYGRDTLGVLSFDFSPDSRELVVATNRHPEPTLHPWKDELLRIDLARGKAIRIPGLPPGPKMAVRWSPDGKAIAYAGRLGNDPAYSCENLELFLCDPIHGRARSLTSKHDCCLEAQGLTDAAAAFGEPDLHFSPDGNRIYFRLSLRGESHVASVEVRGGKLRCHTRGPLDVRLGNLSADGRRIALTVGDAVTLPEAAVADCRREVFRPKRLSNLNGPLLEELELRRPKSHRIRSEDGQPIQLWVIRPSGKAVRKRTKVPAVLEIHGGPHAQYCSSFFHEFQLLAAQGYAVFYSNPRGSKGYGREHCAAIRGRWGGADWTDLQAVIRFMKRQPYVDRQRLGVAGGSYGGYMTNWVISHCRDFAAAITDRCISNLVSSSGTTDYIEPPGFYFSGNFWDQTDARWEQSPLRYAGNVTTPTLVIHSEGDLRCSIEQAEQFYTALRILGVPARFVRYPAATSHGMSRSGPPDLRIHRLRQILGWWRRYLLGKRDAENE